MEIQANNIYFLFWGSWVAQAVKRPTLGFGSGRDLGMLGSRSLLSRDLDSGLDPRTLGSWPELKADA